MRTPHSGFEVSSPLPHQDKNSYTSLWHTETITYLLLTFSPTSLIAASAGPDSPIRLSCLRAAKLAYFCPVVCFPWHKLSSLGHWAKLFSALPSTSGQLGAFLPQQLQNCVITFSCSSAILMCWNQGCGLLISFPGTWQAVGAPELSAGMNQGTSKAYLLLYCSNRKCAVLPPGHQRVLSKECLGIWKPSPQEPKYTMKIVFFIPIQNESMEIFRSFI